MDVERGSCHFLFTVPEFYWPDRCTAFSRCRHPIDNAFATFPSGYPSKHLPWKTFTWRSFLSTCPNQWVDFSASLLPLIKIGCSCDTVVHPRPSRPFTWELSRLVNIRDYSTVNVFTYTKAGGKHNCNISACRQKFNTAKPEYSWSCLLFVTLLTCTQSIQSVV